MKKILICGAGGTPSTNFVRSIRKMDEDIFIVGVDSNKYTLQRAETNKKYLVPRADNENYIDILNTIIEENNIEFIHAQNDVEIHYISENREKLKAKVFLPTKQTIQLCQDKYASYSIWAGNGIKVPKTKMIYNERALQKAFDEFGPKMWIRHITGGAGKDSYPAQGYEDALAWINFKNGWGHFTAAEMLLENSITWSSIWNNGELIVAQSRKRLYWEFADRAPSGITGITGTGVTFSDKQFDDLAIKSILAIDNNPNGLFSVDMTYDKDMLPNPTEINIGRFFTTHYFFTEAGLNLPEIFLKIAYNEPFVVPTKKINPLPDNLAWVRGMDCHPVLTTMDEIEQENSELQDRLNTLK